MSSNQTSSNTLDFDSGASMSRRRAELLPDGSYLFEDDLQIRNLATTKIITCAAWLLELYDLEAGEVFFRSDETVVCPNTRSFGVFYPPFSISEVSLNNLKGHLLGIAATRKLPAEFESTPIVFELDSIQTPESTEAVIEILKAAVNRQSIDFKPNASDLSLKAKRLLDENHLAHPSIGNVARRLGVSHAHLSRQFKGDFGMTPSEYFRMLRVADAPLRLARGEQIIEISEDVGYNDLSRFYKQFRKTTNTSPGACKTILRPKRA